MSDLPVGWEWVTLDEVAHIKGGIQKQPKRAPRNNSAPFLRVANVQRGSMDLADIHRVELFDGELDLYRLARGDLLVVEGNGSIGQLGRSAVWRGEIDGCVHQNHLIRVRPSFAIDADFLGATWNSELVTKQLSAVAGSTSGLHTLSVSKLSAIRLPLPPLAEQHRIVDQINVTVSGLDLGASSLRAAQRRIDGIERRIVAEALSGGGVPGRASAEPFVLLSDVPVRDGDLPSLPAHWRWARLYEIADVVGGVTKDAARQSDPAVPLVPYLRVANVQRGRLDLDHISEIRVAEAKVEKLVLRVGDVLLNEGGDRDKLGRGWIWEGQIERCIHQNHVFRARIRGGALHPKLLAWHANGSGHWFEINGKQSVNLASISLRTIKQLPVPVPPREEQPGIVRAVEGRLAEFARLRAALGAAQEAAAALRRSVLADAFAGRLVPQDPSDESASALLARVRAERAAQPSARRRGAWRASR